MRILISILFGIHSFLAIADHAFTLTCNQNVFIPGQELWFGLISVSYTHLKHDYTLSWTPGARTEDWPLAAAAIIQTKENEFFIAGTGVVITFKNNENPDLHTGILKAEEGQFENGKWKVMRHLNGDQTHQGRHVNIPTQQIAIQRVELYNYK